LTILADQTLLTDSVVTDNN